VTGIVANRWFEQNPDGSIREVGCAAQPNPGYVPGSPPLFYREVDKGGRLYVFASKRELLAWEGSGELGKAITRLGYGPKGETVVFDGEDAIVLFNLSHARPAESFPPRGTISGPANLRVPTLGDRLVEGIAEERLPTWGARLRAVAAACAGGIAAWLALRFGTQQGGWEGYLLAAGCLSLGGLSYGLVAKGVPTYLLLVVAGFLAGAAGAFL